MSGTLFLFTYTYPYGTAETFLETEIRYLAAAWERVVVLPSRIEGENRSVPAGVEVESRLAERLARAHRPAEVAAMVLDPAFRAEVTRRPTVLARTGYLRRLTGQVALARSTGRWIEERLLRGRDPARTALFYTYWMSQAAFGLARLKRSGTRLVFVTRAHGYDLYAERHTPPYLPLQREIVARADAVFTISEHGRSYLAWKYPEHAGRVEVSRLGVLDPGMTTPGSVDGRWRVLSCSGLLPVKRVELLVRGLSVLAARNPDRVIQWDHLGDGPLRARIEQEARERLPDNVEWTIHGHLPNPAVIEYYRTRPVDVLVNVSESEGIPVSMMEAQSFGVPVVATAVGGVPEIVNADNGALLPPDADPAQIADAIELVCLESTSDARIRRASRESWRERYDAERNYSAFVRRLQEVQQEVRATVGCDPARHKPSAAQ